MRGRGQERQGEQETRGHADEHRGLGGKGGRLDRAGNPGGFPAGAATWGVMEAHGGPALPDELLEEAGWLRGLARALCRDEADALDLEQETWLAALRGGAHARDARAWLGSVARRLAAGRGRSEGRRDAREQRVASERPPEAPDTADTLAQVELSARLARAVAELDEPYRTTLALRYYEGLPPRRIAARLGVDVRAVESRLRRGREKLREALDRDCGGREVWFGAALALALAGGDHGGKALALAAALLLLVGGGGTALVIHRTSTHGEPAASLAAELHDPVAPFAAASDSPPPLEREDPGPRSPVGVVAGGVVLVDAAEGAPLAGVHVTWNVALGRGGALSDDQGRVEFGDVADEGTLSLVVAATRSTRVHHANVPARALTRVEVPRRGGRIRGSVVDVEGRPVPEATVLAWARAGHTPDVGRPDRSAVTDALGRFELDDMADERGRRQGWSLAATAPGRCTFGRLEGSVDPRREPDEVTLVVEEAWDVRGRVTDGSGRAVIGAQLIAFHADRPAPGSKPGPTWAPSRTGPGLSVHSAEDGGFAFQVVRPTEAFERAWRLQVNSPSHPTLLTELAGPGWLDVVLEWGGRLDGVVVDAVGNPVPGARVELRARDPRSPATTDGQGCFAFEGLTELEGALLAVTAEGHALAIHDVDLVSFGAQVRVQLEPACRLEGLVQDASGAALAGQLVQFEGDRLVDSAWWRGSMGYTWEELCIRPELWSDAAGRFAVDGLYPGRYRLSLRPGPGAELSAFAEVELRPDGIDRPVLLRVGEGLERTLTVRGRVVDAHGLPVDPFFLDARRYREGASEPTREAAQGEFSGTSGTFELCGLQPGRWSFGAWSSTDGRHRGTIPTQPRLLGPGVVDLGELRFVEPSSR